MGCTGGANTIVDVVPAADVSTGAAGGGIAGVCDCVGTPGVLPVLVEASGGIRNRGLAVRVAVTGCGVNGFVCTEGDTAAAWCMAAGILSLIFVEWSGDA